jgi:hypothetical protein
MKRNLVLFIVLVLVLIVAKLVYSKYCESKPQGCKKSEKIDYEKDGLPKEGVDY